MHEVLVNRLGGLSLPRKSVVRLTDRPDMTLDVYRGRKTTMQQHNQQCQDLYLLYLPERSDKNVIIVRPSIVASHSNEHAVVNQQCSECGTCYPGVVKIWSVWLNEHTERKRSISSVRNAASAIFTG